MKVGIGMTPLCNMRVKSVGRGLGTAPAGVEGVNVSPCVQYKY